MPLRATLICGIDPFDSLCSSCFRRVWSRFVSAFIFYACSWFRACRNIYLSFFYWVNWRHRTYLGGYLSDRFRNRRWYLGSRNGDDYFSPSPHFFTPLVTLFSALPCNSWSHFGTNVPGPFRSHKLFTFGYGKKSYYSF